MTNDCAHEAFDAEVDVIRLSDVEGGFSVDLRAGCVACGERLRFLGVPVGLLGDRPAMSVSGLELHAPARMAGDDRGALPMASFTVRSIQPRSDA